ncbi:Ger(x)C family spore germination protein [Ornithinibacillus californiensis]|uniref:Ger(x)C family spore germination protein n=1 Tax=Ornithinibacillus californiensis TaxID=161536 RepID=UPI00064DC95C|nr:Ger(x)C family spore germination protein [Ornithinibacillus californiensis]
MRKLTIMIFSTMLFLSSCLPTLQLEDLGVITSQGVDMTEKDEIEITMSVLQFQANSTSPTTIVSGVGSTIKGAVEDAGQKVSQQLVPGKLELEIYSKEVAEKGIQPYLDTLRRDANIPDTLFLAVAEEKAKDIFHIKEEYISTNIGEFLHGLIQPGSEQRLFPGISINKFSTYINNEGIDPIAPIIGLREGTPVITGIALFKDDKMKGQLPIEFEHYFTLNEGTVREDLVEFELPMEPFTEYLPKGSGDEEKLKIVALIEEGNGKIKLKDKKALKFDTNIKIVLNLLEISRQYKLDDPKAIAQLEKEIEKQTKSQYEDILKYLKELNTDIFGYGMIYRTNKKGGKLTDKEWDEKYPNIDVTFNVKVDIVRHGTVNR